MKLPWIIPQEKKFFDMLEQYAGLVKECAHYLNEMFTDMDKREKKWLDIKETEKKGDELLARLVSELNATFVTPMDREDIYALGNLLDDILDFAEGTADRVMLFKIGTPPPNLVEFSQLLASAADELACAMPILRNIRKHRNLMRHFAEIHRLESHGDKLLRLSVVELFETQNAVEIIKLKEIYEHVEESLDRVEDVAEKIENLIVKHS